MADIFLSYSSKDRDFATRLAHRLEELGWTVFWDRRTPIGKSFHDALEQEIDSASCVLVIWTHNSVLSSWVITEAEEGRRRNILIPTMIGDPKIPLGFRSLQAAKLDDWIQGSSPEEFKMVVDAIGNIVPPVSKKKSNWNVLDAETQVNDEQDEADESRSGGREEKLQRRTPNPAFMRSMTPSTQLAAIIGDKAVPRTEVTKLVWEYIKKNNLQDKAKKTMINADPKLMEIFKKSQVSMFEMTKLINAHLK